MGSILAYALSNHPDKSNLNELKSKFMLEPLIDIIDLIDENLAEENVYVPLNQFKECFSKYLSLVLIEKTYSKLSDESNEKGEVLKFELYSVFILLCKGSFEAKINTIFNVFCINEENTLFGQDLILLIKSVIYSIFRTCKIPLPDDDEIRNLLNRHFPLALSDEYFELPYEEFYDWVSKNDEVHSFLMEFFDIQTRYNAMKTYIKYLSEFELIFDTYKLDEETLKTKKEFKKSNIFDKSSFMLFSKDETNSADCHSYCSVDQIFNEIGMMLLKIDPKVKQIFIELIDPDKSNYARKDKYMKAIKAVCLFMSVDKDMSHSLSKSEMGTLIWLLSGEEPNDNNLNGTIEKLDANGDSAIELSEWLDFLATRDNRGRKVLNYTLKQKFDLYDEDGNGTISVDELEKMIIDSFQDLLSKAVGDNKKMAENVVRDLAKIIMQKMDFNNSNNLDWTEFKNYLHVASTEEEKIAEYIEKFVLN